MATVRSNDKTALMVVDVQVGVMQECENAAQTIANVARTVERARAAQVPVIWVQHESDELKRDSDAWQWVPALVPAAGEDSSGGESLDGVATADTGGVAGQGAASPEPPAPIVAETLAVSATSLPAYGVARGGLLSRVRRAAVDRRARRSESRASNSPKAPGGAAAPADSEAEESAAPVGMPQPKVTASALSVVVPAVGQAVLYQRLLLPADAAYAVEVSAREPLISRD